MSMTITLGWWLVPALMTIAAVVWAVRQSPPGPSHGYAALGDAAICFFFLSVALIVSLAAWLVWAVLT